MWLLARDRQMKFRNSFRTECLIHWWLNFKSSHRCLQIDGNGVALKTMVERFCAIFTVFPMFSVGIFSLARPVFFWVAGLGRQTLGACQPAKARVRGGLMISGFRLPPRNHAMARSGNACWRAPFVVVWRVFLFWLWKVQNKLLRFSGTTHIISYDTVWDDTVWYDTSYTVDLEVWKTGWRSTSSPPKWEKSWLYKGALVPSRDGFWEERANAHLQLSYKLQAGRPEVLMGKMMKHDHHCRQCYNNAILVEEYRGILYSFVTCSVAFNRFLMWHGPGIPSQASRMQRSRSKRREPLKATAFFSLNNLQPTSRANGLPVCVIYGTAIFETRCPKNTTNKWNMKQQNMSKPLRGRAAAEAAAKAASWASTTPFFGLAFPQPVGWSWWIKSVFFCFFWFFLRF